MKGPCPGWKAEYEERVRVAKALRIDVMGRYPLLRRDGGHTVSVGYIGVGWDEICLICYRVEFIHGTPDLDEDWTRLPRRVFL